MKYKHVGARIYVYYNMKYLYSFSRLLLFCKFIINPRASETNLKFHISMEILKTIPGKT